MKTSKEAAADAAETATSVLRAPNEWADRAFPPGAGRIRKGAHPDRWQHAAAAALHGWDAHAHHAGEPLQLSAEDYYRALVAASAPDGAGNYRPHAGALSRHAPAGKG